jgi:hypothetical protein
VRPAGTGPAVALLAGLLPIVAAHAAYLLNVYAGGAFPAEFICMPYLDGCVSISRAARSGPGLQLFRWLMLPSAALLLLNWELVRRWLGGLRACTGQRGWAVAGLGMIGAVFLVLYVTALGNEDEWYRWQRRYGVILYFGGTALAQLLLVWVLWPGRRRLASGRLLRPITLLTVLVSLQWALGVFSAVKRLIFEDPVFIDRLENVIEWWYALPMSLAFLAVAWMLARTRGMP